MFENNLLAVSDLFFCVIIVHDYILCVIIVHDYILCVISVHIHCRYEEEEEERRRRSGAVSQWSGAVAEHGELAQYQ